MQSHDNGNESPRRVFQRDEATPSEAVDDREEDLPYGWLSPKPLMTLHFQWPDGKKRGFRYMHLDSDMEYTGDKIVLRFFGSKPAEVTITGRNLERVYLGIGDDRWRILRQQPRDFAPDGETFIGKIDVRPLQATE